MCELRATQKIVLSTEQQNMVPVCTNAKAAHLLVLQKPHQPSPGRKRFLSPPQRSNLRKITRIDVSAVLANFTVLTPNQANHIKLVAPEHFSLPTQHPDNATLVVDQLFQDEQTSTTRKNYPTPETCQDRQTLKPLDGRIYDAIVNLRQQEKLDPMTSDEQRQTLLSRFNWDYSQSTSNERAQVQHLLVKYHSIFAGHWLDFGFNTDFKLKLTPKHDQPVYAQSLPTRTKLKDEILVAFALMQYYDVINFSKYSSPIFAQRKKPNREFRLLMDLRRINHLAKHEYIEHNHPVKTIADVA